MRAHDETAQIWGSQPKLCSSERRLLFKTCMNIRTTECTNKITLPCLRLAAGSQQARNISRKNKNIVLFTVSQLGDIARSFVVGFGVGGWRKWASGWQQSSSSDAGRFRNFIQLRQQVYCSVWSFIFSFHVEYSTTVQCSPLVWHLYYTDSYAVTKKAFLRTRYADIWNILCVFQNFSFLISRILSFSNSLLDLKKIVSYSGIINVHFHDLGDSKRDGGIARFHRPTAPATEAEFGSARKSVSCVISTGAHEACQWRPHNNRCIQRASWNHSTTWWSAQRIISAHSPHIAYGTPSALHVHRSPRTFDVTSVTVHCNIQWNLWTAITSVLPLLSFITNLLCIKVLVTNNYTNPYRPAARQLHNSTTRHFVLLFSTANPSIWLQAPANGELTHSSCQQTT